MLGKKEEVTELNLSTGGVMHVENLNATDSEIIHGREAGRDTKYIAQKVGLSVSLVLKRIVQLRDMGFDFPEVQGSTETVAHVFEWLGYRTTNYSVDLADAVAWADKLRAPVRGAD